VSIFEPDQDDLPDSAHESPDLVSAFNPLVFSRIGSATTENVAHDATVGKAVGTTLLGHWAPGLRLAAYWKHRDNASSHCYYSATAFVISRSTDSNVDRANGKDMYHP
jgi:hypothetical protein